jgi:RimJ/RimL family protein N-acetyltransferase
LSVLGRLDTERLILRPWEERDLAPLSAILADPLVRRFYPAISTPADTKRNLDWAIARTAEHGFHFWAVERRADGMLLGLCGLGIIDEELRGAIPGRPAVEIGWQLDKSCWGQGFAPEAASAWLDHAWNVLHLDEVVAFTAQPNLPSQRVMQKLGMRHDPAGDFEHPRILAGNPLRSHVLYRVGRPQA